VAQALHALPVIEESIAEDENVYELAACRSSTASLSPDASHEQEPSIQNATAEGQNHSEKRVSYEEEINRLSHENERQQVQIHNLEAQLSFAERKAQCLQVGKLPCQRRLKKRISELVEEVQSKEEEVKKWVDIQQNPVQTQSTLALQTIGDDMKALACLLRDICHDLRTQVQDLEQKRRTLDRKTKRMAMGWIEDEFEELCYRLTEGSSE
jgi:predicted  nucleic acid-binding Zn-ribbon protein